MSTPISFTVRPPGSTSSSYRPSPLGNGGSSRGPPSRRLFEQNGDDDDDDEDHYGERSRSHSSRPRDERIEGFGNGRAIGGEKPAGPLVIPALPNRDWRQSSTANSRKAPSYRPETRDPNEVVETHERTGDKPQRSGLRNVVKTERSDDGDAYVKSEPVEDQGQQDPLPESAVGIGAVKSEPLTLEEQALQAILQGDVKRETEEERLQRELVIKMDAGRFNGLSEEDALKRDIDALPEESSADDYAAVPVSAFGEAMARGMGWNPSVQGTKIHEPKLRPALLGLGATALEKPLPPSRSGSSSKKQPKVNKRDSMKYVLADALVKKEGAPSGASTPASGGSRRSTPESEGKRRREDEDGRESKRRDREYETDEERARRKAKERERDYETDEERARRKAKERERRERYDGDRDREQERGERDRYVRRDDRDRERDKGRDRRDDRDRDSRDRRDRDDRRDDRRDRDRYPNGDRDGDRERRRDR